MAVTSMSQSSIGDFSKRNTFRNPVIVMGGSEIALVGGYQYHLFTESSGFTIVQGGVSAEILVVGAGGSGGAAGGGGGAGAIEIAGPGYYSAQTLTAGTYGVNVGAGGARTSGVGNNGGSSIFYGTSTITALGGGGGGYSGGVGTGGGSGGGGSSVNNTTRAGGAASGNNTNAGGQATGTTGTWYDGGGGGGATAAGGPVLLMTLGRVVRGWRSQLLTPISPLETLRLSLG
jgi:hypothetical protein